jgi:ABC-type xylose transport system permease subunit
MLTGLEPGAYSNIIELIGYAGDCVERDTCLLRVTTALVVLYAFATTRTVIGRQIYTVGGNAKSAKLPGIKNISPMMAKPVAQGVRPA